MVGKTSRGLDDTTRKRLNSKLEKDHGWLSGRVVPDWIHGASTTTDRATDYAHKDNIQVVEVEYFTTICINSIYAMMEGIGAFLSFVRHLLGITYLTISGSCVPFDFVT